MLANRVLVILSRIVTLSEKPLNNEEIDARIACNLNEAYNCHDKCKEVISSAHKDLAGSRRLSDQAGMVIELVRSAERAPRTNFMPDIAVNVLKVMEDLFTHVRYEAGHPIFHWVRNMNMEASALEGRMHALKVLLEAELEWKKNHGDSRGTEHDDEDGANAT
ncbi:hypothetical protein AX14_013084 [Amanita brunnescens Koide BX004]|nr:hypothetical protein AX14_013084 [Amanita brunnescens Koide BX004]